MGIIQKVTQNLDYPRAKPIYVTWDSYAEFARDPERYFERLST